MLVVSVLLLSICQGELYSAEIERWDIMMSEEVQVWNYLLEDYFYGPKEEHWPKRKKALEKIVNEFPDSQWADDASLILACGKFEFEHNAEGALSDLKSIGSKYPNGKTIINPWWSAGAGCKIDEVWMMGQGRLSYRNRDGSVRKGKPFDSDSVISMDEKEILAYFSHIERNPIFTKDAAHIFVAEILGHQGEYEAAVDELRGILSRALQQLNSFEADGRFSVTEDGFYGRTLSRPQFRACIALMGYCEKTGDIETAVSEIDKFSVVLNQSASYSVIKQVGQFYEKHGFVPKATLQYQKALEKVNNYIAADRIRSQFLEYIERPSDEELSPDLKQEASWLKANIR